MAKRQVRNGWREKVLRARTAFRLHRAVKYSRWILAIRCLILFSVAAYWLAPAPSLAQQGTVGGQITPDNDFTNPRTNSISNAPPQPSNDAIVEESVLPAGLDVESMLSPGGLSSTLKIMLMLTVLSLAPSILIMTTCFIRFVIVIGLLRQALGTQQLPPNQVIISLCLFLTFMVMAPVWKESYEQGVRPYTSPQPGDVAVGFDEALQRTLLPIREFMSGQIEAADNSDAIWMFLEFQRPAPDSPAGQNYQLPKNYEEVPISVLLPSYMLSELKTAFIIGFQVYLPFLVIDMVVASVLISMGMMMLPPVLISLPFKLLLFVMIDGWYLTVGMLLDSVRPFG